MSPAKTRAKKKRIIPPPTTIGCNPLDEVVSHAAVLSAIRGLAAGERAEKREVRGAAKRRKR